MTMGYGVARSRQVLCNWQSYFQLTSASKGQTFELLADGVSGIDRRCTPPSVTTVYPAKAANEAHHGTSQSRPRAL